MKCNEMQLKKFPLATGARFTLTPSPGVIPC